MEISLCSALCLTGLEVLLLLRADTDAESSSAKFAEHKERCTCAAGTCKREMTIEKHGCTT